VEGGPELLISRGRSQKKSETDQSSVGVQTKCISVQPNKIVMLLKTWSLLKVKKRARDVAGKKKKSVVRALRVFRNRRQLTKKGT